MRCCRLPAAEGACTAGLDHGAAPASPPARGSAAGPPPATPEAAGKQLSSAASLLDLRRRSAMRSRATAGGHVEGRGQASCAVIWRQYAILRAC